MASFLGNAMLQVLGLCSAVLAARLLVPEARGELAAATTWALVLSALADLGVSQAVPFYAAKRQVRLGATAVLTGLVLGLLLAPFSYGAVRLLGYALSTPAIAYAICAVPTSLGVTYLGGIFQGESRHSAFALCRVLGNMPYVLGLILVGLGVGHGSGSVLLVALLASLVIWLSMIAWARWSTQSFGVPDYSVLKKLVSFGLRTYPGNLAWTGNQRIPLLLLGAILGKVSLGYYSVAQSYAIAPFAIAGAFALLAPGRIASRSGFEATRAGRRLCLAGIATTWMVALALAPFASLVIPLVFGEIYRPSSGPAVLLVLASGFVGTNFVLSATLRALGSPTLPSYAEMIGLVLTILLGPILIMQFGVLGSAWTALAGSALITLVLAVVGKASWRQMTTRTRNDTPTIRISILTPAFNAADHIRELMSSIEHQEYGNYEHVVIDDGSSDDTYEIVRGSPETRVFRRPNRGQYATQNELLSLALGDVVVVICADDYFAGPSALRRVADAFHRDPNVEVVVGRTPRKVEGSNPYLAHPDIPTWLAVRSVEKCLAIQHCSVFVKRDLIDRYALHFDDTYRMRGDWDWLIRVFSVARRVKVIDKDLGVWRLHPNQTSAVTGELGVNETMRLLETYGGHVGQYWRRRIIYDFYARSLHMLAILSQHGPITALRLLQTRRRRAVGRR